MPVHRHSSLVLLVMLYSKFDETLISYDIIYLILICPEADILYTWRIQIHMDGTMLEMLITDRFDLNLKERES